MIGFSYEYLSNDALCTVFINNNRAGSAFLFLHNERMYALTAYLNDYAKAIIPHPLILNYLIKRFLEYLQIMFLEVSRLK